MTNTLRDFSAVKLSEILPKISTTEQQTNFSLIRENYPSINSRYFGKMTNTLRDFFWGNYLKFCQKSPLLNNRQISPSSGKIIHQLILAILGK
ncbi:MAG: hypothetical protein SWX82_07725 [Cyanobacteriota bacterium]|nr:hypothetical protein [Cyanobacteriota bacterium]